MTTEETRWWMAEDDPELASRVLSDVQAIDQHDEQRMHRNERCLRMYGQHFTIGQSEVTHIYQPARKMLALNVVRSIVDALHSELVQNRPHASFLTGGDDMDERWRLQRRARKAEQFVEGVFDECAVYETMSRMALDSLIFDGSIAKVFARDGQIKVERVLPWELKVDPRASIYGTPREYKQTKFVDRAVLRDLYPDKAEQISGATRYTIRSMPWADGGSDQVLVTEAWRLPTKPGGKGRWCSVTDSCVLEDEDWLDDAPPFVWFMWALFPVGFWGDSPANQLAGVQYEINKLLLEIQEAHHLLGKSKILWPTAAGSPKPYWDNQVGSIIPVADMRAGAPQVVAPQVVSAEVYQHLERLYRFAYEITAASQISAQARVPEALSGSGKSVEVYEDATSRRHIAPGRRYEQLAVDLSKQIIRAVRRAGESGDKFKARWVGRRAGRDVMRSVDWKDVAIEEGKFRLRVFPTSQLPRTPAGRLRTVETWINLGWITPDEGMRLLEMPDIDAYANLRNASWDLITEYIDQILDMDPDGDEPAPIPDPMMDLNMASSVMSRAVIRAKLDGAPEANIEMLRTFVLQCEQLKPKPPEPQLPPPAAPKQEAA